MKINVNIIDGKKTCLLHGCDVKHCKCSDEVSQLDFYRVESETKELPFVVRLGGSASGLESHPGPFVLVHEYTRKEEHLTGNKTYYVVECRLVEVRVVEDALFRLKVEAAEKASRAEFMKTKNGRPKDA